MLWVSMQDFDGFLLVLNGCGVLFFSHVQVAQFIVNIADIQGNVHQV